MQYTRGIPIVPLADVGSPDVTIGDVVAASQLAAEETGWPETLLPAPRTWRVTAPAGDVRIIWGMPFLEAVTPGPAAAPDNSEIVEASISKGGVQSIQHVSGFGWLEPIGELTRDLSATATAIPNVELAAGEALLVGSELIWHDGTRLVRESAVAHPSTTPIRRVRAQSSLALAVTRMAKRAADVRARAGASRRRRSDDRAEGPLVVLDGDSRRALTPFRRPASWLQALPAEDIAGGTIASFDVDKEISEAIYGILHEAVTGNIEAGIDVQWDVILHKYDFAVGQAVAGRGFASWIATASFDAPTNVLTIDLGGPAADPFVPVVGDTIYWVMPDVGDGTDAIQIRIAGTGGATIHLHDRDGIEVVNYQLVGGRFYSGLRVGHGGSRAIRFYEPLSLNVLPPGTSMNTDLRWDDIDGRWEATSPVTTVHAILVRDLTVATLSAGMIHALDNSLTSYPGSASSGAYADSFAEIIALNTSGVQIGPDPRGLLPFAYSLRSRGSFSDSSQSSTISNVWRPGDPLPYLVVFSPSAFAWASGFSARYEEITDPDFFAVNGRRTLDLVPAITRNAYEVNGVDYDQVAFPLMGNPPPPFNTRKVDWQGGEARGRISWSYTQPPNPDAMFVPI